MMNRFRASIAVRILSFEVKVSARWAKRYATKSSNASRRKQVRALECLLWGDSVGGKLVVIFVVFSSFSICFFAVLFLKRVE